MRGVDDIRRENLRAESKRLGSDAKLYRKIGKNKNQVYQWLRATGAQQRNISTEIAREIEPKLGRPLNWLDVDRSGAQPEAAPPAEVSEATVAGFAGDVDVLRTFLLATFRRMVENRPDEALDVAREYRIAKPDKVWQDHGFAAQALRILDAARKTAASAAPQHALRAVGAKSKRPPRSRKRPSSLP